MNKLVLLSLGHGSVQSGFPAVQSQLWNTPDTLPIKFMGSLPASPELASCYNKWQLLYRATYHYLDWPLRIKLNQGDVVQISDIEFHDLHQQLTALINNWLSSDAFLNITRQLRRELAPEDTIRVIVESNDPLVRRLPWHLWNFFEDYPKAEVALSASEYGRGQVRPKRHRVRILAVLGNPAELDLAADRQMLEALPNTDLVFLEEPRRQVLAQHLWDKAGWDILFFAGHSQTEQNKGRIYLNPDESLTLEELKHSLRHAITSGLQIAIFNSCDGLGLVEALAQLNLPQIIAMREPVPDRVAQVFLGYFLTAFASGDSLYLAVRQARERLQEIEDEFPYASWLPVICQNPASAPLQWHQLQGLESIELSSKSIAGVRSSTSSSSLLDQDTYRYQLIFENINLVKVLVSAALTTLAVMGLRWLGGLAFLELKVYDQMTRLQPEESPDNRLVIVEVTQDDISRLQGEYPISDATLLRTLQTISAYDPALIGVDIYRDRPEGEGWQALHQYLTKHPHVVSICTNPDENGFAGIAPPKDIPAEQLGFSDVVVDDDGIIRRHLLALDPHNESACPPTYSLSAHLSLSYLRNQGISLDFPSIHRWQIGSINFDLLRTHWGFYQTPQLTSGHQIMLNYRVYQTFDEITERIPLTAILDNQVTREQFANKIVLIGVSDPSIKDDFDTPYGISIRGIELHAQMISQVISAVEDERTVLQFWPLWADVLWVGGWALLGSVVAWRCRSVLICTFISGAAGLTLFIFGLGLLYTGTIVATVPSALGLLITYSIRPTIQLIAKQPAFENPTKPELSHT